MHVIHKKIYERFLTRENLRRKAYRTRTYQAILRTQQQQHRKRDQCPELREKEAGLRNTLSLCPAFLLYTGEKLLGENIEIKERFVSIWQPLAPRSLCAIAFEVFFLPRLCTSVLSDASVCVFVLVRINHSL